ncbi:UNVERIFIED_CONTAM: putative sucrose-phosphate synthase 4 [Sesamum radiatum]|uniref:Sucrose-phosphate synthase 4 n=1 Tax=Sesamum radiatum TaxID=300843 RepID=A0AAW2PWX5_SESRA
MRENEWLNGYLEAILDIGTSRNGTREAESSCDDSERGKLYSLKNSIKEKLGDERLKLEKLGIQKQKEEKLFSPTKYFVEEVVNSFDEAELHRTWIKVIATRSSRQRNNRLENMCWRIWHLARKKKQVKYVVELARALVNMEGVHRVDLLTRQITSSEVDSTYGEPIEMLSCPSDGFGSCGAYIIRIPCGPPEKYLSIRWSIELPKMVVFLGERGDTDYEELLGGLHKTVILRGSVDYASEMIGHSEESFKTDDTVSQASKKIVLAEGFEVNDISKVLGCIGIM